MMEQGQQTQTNYAPQSEDGRVMIATHELVKRAERYRIAWVLSQAFGVLLFATTLRFLVENIGETWWYADAIALALAAGVTLYSLQMAQMRFAEAQHLTRNPQSFALRLRRNKAGNLYGFGVDATYGIPLLLLNWLDWQAGWVALIIGVIFGGITVALAVRMLKAENQYTAQLPPPELYLDYTDEAKRGNGSIWVMVVLMVACALNVAVGIMNIAISLSFTEHSSLQWLQFISPAVWLLVPALYWVRFRRIRQMRARLMAAYPGYIK